MLIHLNTLPGQGYATFAESPSEEREQAHQELLSAPVFKDFLKTLKAQRPSEFVHVDPENPQSYCIKIYRELDGSAQINIKARPTDLGQDMPHDDYLHQLAGFILGLNEYPNRPVPPFPIPSPIQIPPATLREESSSDATPVQSPRVKAPLPRSRRYRRVALRMKNDPSSSSDAEEALDLKTAQQRQRLKWRGQTAAAAPSAQSTKLASRKFKRVPLKLVEDPSSSSESSGPNRLDAKRPAPLKPVPTEPHPLLIPDPSPTIDPQVELLRKSLDELRQQNQKQFSFIQGLVAHNQKEPDRTKTLLDHLDKQNQANLIRISAQIDDSAQARKQFLDALQALRSPAPAPSAYLIPDPSESESEAAPRRPLPAFDAPRRNAPANQDSPRARNLPSLSLSDSDTNSEASQPRRRPPRILNRRPREAVRSPSENAGSDTSESLRGAPAVGGNRNLGPRDPAEALREQLEREQQRNDGLVARIRDLHIAITDLNLENHQSGYELELLREQAAQHFEELGAVHHELNESGAANRLRAQQLNQRLLDIQQQLHHSQDQEHALAQRIQQLQQRAAEPPPPQNAPPAAQPPQPAPPVQQPVPAHPQPAAILAPAAPAVDVPAAAELQRLQQQLAQEQQFRQQMQQAYLFVFASLAQIHNAQNRMEEQLRAIPNNNGARQIRNRQPVQFPPLPAPIAFPVQLAPFPEPAPFEANLAAAAEPYEEDPISLFSSQPDDQSRQLYQIYCSLQDRSVPPPRSPSRNASPTVVSSPAYLLQLFPNLFHASERQAAPVAQRQRPLWNNPARRLPAPPPVAGSAVENRVSNENEVTQPFSWWNSA